MELFWPVLVTGSGQGHLMVLQENPSAGNNFPIPDSLPAAGSGGVPLLWGQEWGHPAEQSLGAPILPEYSTWQEEQALSTWIGMAKENSGAASRGLGIPRGFSTVLAPARSQGGFAAPAFQGIHKTKCWDPIEPSNIQWHFPRRRRRSRAEPQGPGRAPAEIILFCQAPFPPAAPIGHGAWRFFSGRCISGPFSC